MKRERWDDLVATIKDSYPVSNEGHERLEDRPGEREFIEFNGPIGKVRLELLTTPIVTGSKGMGGHKVGAATAIRYEYSQEEKAVKFLAYRWVDGDWQPIDATSFMK